MRIIRATALLVASVAFLALGIGQASADAAASDHLYVGVSKCKSCHKKEAIGNQYGVWSDTKHAKAFETLGTDKAKEWASKKGISDPQASEKCLKCHLTAYGVPAAGLDKSFAKDTKKGVQCESCHGPGKDYKKKKTMADRDKAKSKGLIIPTEETCTKCHNDESPAWDAARYTTKDGKKVGFDFEQAKKEIEHPVPEGYDPFAKKK